MGNQNSICCDNNWVDTSKTASFLIVYCVSGTLLTLGNKLLVVRFPYANILLVLQNAMSVLLLIFFSRVFRRFFSSLPSLNLDVVKLWLPLVLLFVMMLSSSLVALMYVSVPTLIVIRNLITLVVALLEYICLGNKMDGISIVTLIGMLLGAILYSKHDLTFSVKGYAWLGANILGTSAYQIYIKKLIHLPTFDNIGSLSMSYYNNLISLPILLICGYFMGEVTEILMAFHLRHILEIKTIGLIGLSGMLGFCLSVSAFALNKLISATSMMVANNANKFSLIIISEIFIQFTLDMAASVGALSVLCLGCLYSQAAKPLLTKILIIVIVAFTSSCIVLEYTNTPININSIAFHVSSYTMNTNIIILNGSFNSNYTRIRDHENS